MSKLTAMQELKNHINDMIDNGGDSDLFCVVGLIDSTFIELEKEQIIEAQNISLRTNFYVDYECPEDYYDTNFNTKQNEK